MAVFSIIQKSQLEGAKRLDAEYYQPEYLEFVKAVSDSGCRIGGVVEFIRHPIEIERVYQEKGEPFLLTQNIKKDFYILDFDTKRYISSENAKKLSKNKLRKGDVVMTRTGANYGDSSLFFGEPKNLLASAHILIIRPEKVSGEYLVTYLNSKIGRSLVERGIYGGLQPEITPDYIKSIFIHLPNKEQEKYFINTLANAFSELENSKNFYSQAEDLLLEELGLENFEAEENLARVVNFSDIKKAERMDAEYFQIKYEKLLKRVKEKNGKLLGELVSIKKGIEPGAESYLEEGKSFIRVSNMSKTGINDNDQKYLSEELYKKLKDDYEPKIGEILLTKDATPGIACVLKEDIEGIIAGGILRLKPKEEIEGEYLALCINSIVGQMQAERDAGGSVIAHWKPEQIKNIIIPVLPRSIQQKIADLVQKSHESRKKAKELLEEAKQKVEELIEK